MVLNRKYNFKTLVEKINSALNALVSTLYCVFLKSAAFYSGSQFRNAKQNCR